MIAFILVPLVLRCLSTSLGFKPPEGFPEMVIRPILSGCSLLAIGFLFGQRYVSHRPQQVLISAAAETASAIIFQFIIFCLPPYESPRRGLYRRDYVL